MVRSGHNIDYVYDRLISLAISISCANIVLPGTLASTVIQRVTTVYQFNKSACHLVWKISKSSRVNFHSKSDILGFSHTDENSHVVRRQLAEWLD